jgi:hypothetical protein
MNQVQVRRKMVRYSLLVWWDEKNGGDKGNEGHGLPQGFVALFFARNSVWMRWKGGDRWEYLLGDVAVASNIIEGAMAVRSCSGTPVSVIMETGDRIKGEGTPDQKDWKYRKRGGDSR